MNKYLKDLPKALIISFSIFLILLLIEVIAGYKVHFDYGFLMKFLYTMLYGISLFYANGAVFDYLDSFYKDNRFPPKRLIIGSLASFAVSVAVIFLLRIFEDVIVENQSFATYIQHEKPQNYLVAIIITFVVTLALHAFHFYKAYQENRLKEQKIIAGTASAKFESLKNQIDPHFLFNSLNVLSSLIEENPDNAQRFTTSLSKIYRYVLEQKDKELVTVQEELTFAKTYMNLLKMRFENSITFELPENFENSDAKVVPLSLQLLLENTIKHNVVSEQKPLHIRIFVRDNYLVVQNDLQKKEVLQDRKGVGLQNIISRYGILTNRKVLIESKETIFAVHLPILTKQVTTMETTYKTNENTAYYKAKKRVEELKGFYGNLISYCVVIPILIYVNLTFVPHFHWFWFSAGGWGFGLLMHAFRVFGYSSDWENRKIKEILEKEQTSTKKLEIVMENQQTIEQKELLELAKKSEKIKNFYSHLFVYVIGVTFFLLKTYSSIEFDFFPIRFINWFVMSIWTVIIGIQMIELFFAEIVFGKKWEDKKIQQIMTKETEKQTWE